MRLETPQTGGGGPAWGWSAVGRSAGLIVRDMGSSCDDTEQESDESSSILKDALAAVQDFDGREQVCTQGCSRRSLALTLKKEDSS